jgi:hypothetical protein
MPPATATTKDGALFRSIRNDFTGRIEKALKRRDLQCSGAKPSEAKHFLASPSRLQARSTAFQTAGAVRPCELSLPDAVKQVFAQLLESRA